MPYRSILITLVTVSLALLTIGMWTRAIAPMLAEVNASTQPSTAPGSTHPAVSFPTTSSAEPAARPDRQFKVLVKGVAGIAFILTCLLFVIGFFATLHSWARSLMKDGRGSKPKRTRYVDAWKIAGERLNPTPENTPDDEPPSPPLPPPQNN
jgi:uncharacterized membrane protein